MQTYTNVNIIRHSTDFAPMLTFYQDHLGFQTVQEWDEPGNQGAILKPPGELSGVTIDAATFTNLLLHKNSISGIIQARITP